MGLQITKHERAIEEAWFTGGNSEGQVNKEVLNEGEVPRKPH